MMHGTKRALTQKAAGASVVPVVYALYDAFTTDRAAGAVNGTVSESPFPTGGGVNRAVVDTGSRLSIAGGKLVVATGGAVYTDPTIAYDGITRALGVVSLFQFTYDSGDTSGSRSGMGFNTSKTAGAVGESYIIINNTNFRAQDQMIIVAVSAGVAREFAIVLRAAGAFYFYKSSGTWLLVWLTTTGSTATLYPRVTPRSIATSSDNIRVPDPAFHLYIPVPLVYDTFTRVNGALGSTETVGPDSQVLAALTWLFTSGVWAVSGNKAVGTPVLGSELITNGGFDADANWTKGGGWSIGGGIASHNGVSGSAITQSVGVAGKWYSVTFTTGLIGADYIRISLGGGQGPFINIDSTTYTLTGLAAGTALGFVTPNGTTAEIDNVSIKQIPDADLFSSVVAPSADVIADGGVTYTAGYQAGLVLNLDSDTNPQNFVVACLHYESNVTTARLYKCVAGTYTLVINASVVYSAGATLRVIKSGTSYALCYNGAQVGSTSTISDAGIVSNTKHGLFSTSPNNSLDNFQLWARGTGGEYAAFDAY